MESWFLPIISQGSEVGAYRGMGDSRERHLIIMHTALNPHTVVADGIVCIYTCVLAC